MSIGPNWRYHWMFQLRKAYRTIEQHADKPSLTKLEKADMRAAITRAQKCLHKLSIHLGYMEQRRR